MSQKNICSIWGIAIFSLVLSWSPLLLQANDANAPLKTFAILSVTDFDTGLKVMKGVAAAVEYPEAVEQFETMLRGFLEENLDFTKPLGIVAQSNGSETSILFFAPLAEIADLPFGAGNFFADAETNDAGWAVVPIPTPTHEWTVYLKQQNGWLYATLGPSMPLLPEDPVSLLEGLHEKNHLAVKVNCQNIPKKLLDDGVAWSGQLVPMIEPMIPTDMPDREKLFFKKYIEFYGKLFEIIADQMRSTVPEVQTLTYTVHLNENHDVVLESEIVAVPGTETAEILDKMTHAESHLAGFYQTENSIFTLNSVAFFPEKQKNFLKKVSGIYMELIDSALTMMEEIDGDDEKAMLAIKTMRPFLEDLKSVADSTIDSGQLEISETLLTDGAIVVAVELTDGMKLEPGIDALFKLTKGPLAKIEEDLDFEIPMEKVDYGDHKIWTLAFPLGKMMQINGEKDSIPESLNSSTLSVVFALSDNMISYGYGVAPNFVDWFKKAIDKSETVVPVPKEQIIIVPQQIGVSLKNFGFTGENLKPLREVLNVLNAIPDDAKITVSFDTEQDTFRQKMVMSGKLWQSIGKLVELGINAFREAQLTGNRFSSPTIGKKLTTEEITEMLAEAETIEQVLEKVARIDEEEREKFSNQESSFMVYYQNSGNAKITGGIKIIKQLGKSDDELEQGYKLKIEGLNSLIMVNPSGEESKELESLIAELDQGGKFAGLVNDLRMQQFQQNIYQYFHMAPSEKNFQDALKEAKALANQSPKTYESSAPLLTMLDLAAHEKLTKENPAFPRKIADELIAFVKSKECTISETEKEETVKNIECICRRMLGADLALYGKTLDDKDLDWNSYRGKYVLVKFTASWCGPCKGEIPGMLEAYQKYRDQGFEIISVGVWDETENLKELINEEKIPWTMLSEELTEKAKQPPQGEFYGINGVPSMLLLDKEGKIILTEARGEVLQKKLKEIFK